MTQRFQLPDSSMNEGANMVAAHSYLSDCCRERPEWGWPGLREGERAKLLLATVVEYIKQL